MLGVQNIDHVSVLITDLERSRRFYRDLLGLKEIAKPRTFDFKVIWFVQPADMVIEPDVTAFDPTEFERTKELAAIGEATPLEQIPKVRQLLTRLDPQLFPAAVAAPALQTA